MLQWRLPKVGHSRGQEDNWATFSSGTHCSISFRIDAAAAAARWRSACVKEARHSRPRLGLEMRRNIVSLFAPPPPPSSVTHFFLSESKERNTAELQKLGPSCRIGPHRIAVVRNVPLVRCFCATFHGKMLYIMLGLDSAGPMHRAK